MNMPKVLGMMLTVADIQKMTTFFTKVLGFKKVGESQLEGDAYDKLYGIPKVKARFVTLKLGKESLYLIEFDPPGKSYPPIRGNDHLFQHIAIVVSDLEKAHQILNKEGITAISEGPVTIPEWNEAAAGIKAFYFQSPEGHPLELIYFPPKKGRLIWQQKENLFLGIDHTAITIFHTEKSLNFYQDVIGMKVFGASLNHGSTQESLSGVPGAKVKITGLGCKEGEMGVEFLHYLHPQDGRSYPDVKASDLGCTYTVIAIDSLDELNVLPLSKGSFSLDHGITINSAITAKDPDGHRLLFLEKRGN